MSSYLAAAAYRLGSIAISPFSYFYSSKSNTEAEPRPDFETKQENGTTMPENKETDTVKTSETTVSQGEAAVKDEGAVKAAETTVEVSTEKNTEVKSEEPKKEEVKAEEPKIEEEVKKVLDFFANEKNIEEPTKSATPITPTQNKNNSGKKHNKNSAVPNKIPNNSR